MISNFGDNKNLFLELKSTLGLYVVVHTSSKFFREKLTLTVVEVQHVPELEKNDS